MNPYIVWIDLHEEGWSRSDYPSLKIALEKIEFWKTLYPNEDILLTKLISNE